MSEGKSAAGAQPSFHSHVFLGEGHEKSERRTWAVIWLCAAMMAAEIVGGWLFGHFHLIHGGGLAGDVIGATVGAVILLLLIRLVRRRTVFQRFFQRRL